MSIYNGKIDAKVFFSYSTAALQSRDAKRKIMEQMNRRRRILLARHGRIANSQLVEQMETFKSHREMKKWLQIMTGQFIQSIRSLGAGFN